MSPHPADPHPHAPRLDAPPPGRLASAQPHGNLRRSLSDLARRTHAEARASTSTSSSAAGAGAPGSLVDHDAVEDGVGGVGVTLLVQGESVFMGSNAFTDAVDRIQYGSGEGPCLSAVAAGRVVTSTRIGTGERRWPGFSRRTAALALRSVTSAPIVLDGAVIGSVNMYSRTPLGLREMSPKVLQRLVDHVGDALGGAHLLARTEAGARHLADALDDRAAVEQAVGLLMERYVMNANQARTLLTQLARHDGVSEPAAARTLTNPEQLAVPDEHS